MKKYILPILILALTVTRAGELLPQRERYEIVL